MSQLRQPLDNPAYVSLRERQKEKFPKHPLRKFTG